MKTLRTDKGIKDTVQEFFLEKLFSSYKAKHGPKAKQDALNAAVAALPSDITSPVWRLQGFFYFTYISIKSLSIIDSKSL